MKISKLLPGVRRRLPLDGGPRELVDSLVICHVAQHTGYPRAPFPMCFTRRAFMHLLNTVGSQPPESGAMGFALKNQFGFDLIEFDEKGSLESGSGVYRPSVEWRSARQECHLALPDTDLRLWSGDLHSHPGLCDSPSGKSGKGLGDLGYVEEVFAMNEAMQWFLIPILTGSGSDDIGIHPWVCRRGRCAPVDLFIADLLICSSPLEFPAREFNPEWERSVEQETVAKSVHRTVAVIMVSEDKENEARRDAGSKSQEATATSGKPLFISSPATAPAVPPAACDFSQTAGGSPEGTEQIDPLGILGQVEEPVDQRDGSRVQAYTKRLQGIISSHFQDKTILMIGAGAGSYALEKLARLCPKRLKVCDFDVVELQNLSRTLYTIEDADCRRLKVDALARRIAAINPWVEMQSYPKSLTSMSRSDLDELFEGVDLVIAGTDRFQPQALANEESVRRRIPAVFIGIHDQAQGGRVVWSLPGVTACYRCVARERYEDFERGGGERVDLEGVIGGILDCQFIDMIAAKIAVAILDRGEASMMGRFFALMDNRNDVVVRCDPEYSWGRSMWDAVLGDLPHEPRDFAAEIREKALFAMDTLWFRAVRDPLCPVCPRGQCPI